EMDVGLLEGLPFGRHVAVVEAVVRRAELFKELKGYTSTLDRHLDRVRAVFPGPACASGPEWIRTLAAHRVPVGDGESKVLLHRLAFDFFVRIVVPKAEWVRRVGAFVADSRNFGEERHVVTCQDGDTRSTSLHHTIAASA